MTTQSHTYVNLQQENAPPPLAPRINRRNQDQDINYKNKYEKEFKTILPFICDKNNKSIMCEFIYSDLDLEPNYELVLPHKYDEDLKLRDKSHINSVNYNRVLDYYIEERFKGRSICQSFHNIKKEYDKTIIFGGGKSKKSRSKKSKRSRTKKNKRSVRK
jgi:hypothetical protein